MRATIKYAKNRERSTSTTENRKKHHVSQATIQRRERIKEAGLTPKSARKSLAIGAGSVFNPVGSTKYYEAIRAASKHLADISIEEAISSDWEAIGGDLYITVVTYKDDK